MCRWSIQFCTFISIYLVSEVTVQCNRQIASSIVLIFVEVDRTASSKSRCVWIDNGTVEDWRIPEAVLENNRSAVATDLFDAAHYCSIVSDQWPNATKLLSVHSVQIILLSVNCRTQRTPAFTLKILSRPNLEGANLSAYLRRSPKIWNIDEIDPETKSRIQDADWLEIVKNVLCHNFEKNEKNDSGYPRHGLVPKCNQLFLVPRSIPAINVMNIHPQVLEQSC